MNKIPTELWVGEHEKLVASVYDYLEKELSIKFGSTASRHIRDRQHHSVRWISPEKKQYRRADLESVEHELSFALAEGEQFFFILEQADLLNPSSANSLLKSLEEPPAGYRFILLVERLALVLPTIRSRSLVKDFGFSTGSLKALSFIEIFKNPGGFSHIEFMTEFEKAQITEYQTLVILDQIYNYWSMQYKNALLEDDIVAAQKADRMIKIISYGFDRLPMPGSAKSFWRNLFLLASL